MLQKVCLILIISFFLLMPAAPIKADVSDCSAEIIEGENQTQGSSGNIVFSLGNPDVVSFLWVKVSVPSANFTITSASSSGWSSSVQSGGSSVIFTGSQITSGATQNFTLTVQSANTTAGPGAFLVETSDSTSGTNPHSCSGGMSVSIIADASPPAISNIAVSSVTSSSATITWITNKGSNSTVVYGLDTSYGNTKSDNTLTTSHSVVLNNLNKQTTYHYKVQSTDSSGNTGTSSDQSFITTDGSTAVSSSASSTATTTSSSSSSSASSASSGSSSSPVPSATPIPKPVDKSPPQVKVEFDFNKVLKTAPVIAGWVSDDTLVSKIEYSIDNGQNWLPVDNAKLGLKSANYDFTPAIFEDGNYQIKVRAVDSNSNTAISTAYTLVIDRLPPRIGGSLMIVGSQILTPSLNSSDLDIFQEVNTKITLSSVGGATEVTIHTKNTDSVDEQKISLVKNKDNNLWSGLIKFNQSGRYQLIAKAVDGAGNKVAANISVVNVLKSGRLLGLHQSDQAAVTVYTLDPDSNNFYLWDGSAYGQQNPQPATSTKEYQFFLPKGKYYLKVTATGYKNLITDIFELTGQGLVNSNLILEKQSNLKLGFLSLPIPDLSATRASIKLSDQQKSVSFRQNYPFINQPLPQTLLYSQPASQDGLKKNSVSTQTLRGKPTVISILNSWFPQTASQLLQLSDLTADDKINSIIIFPQESASTSFLLTERGSYKSRILADPDGELIEKLNLTTLPAHLFINRRGIIKKIENGLLTKQQLLDSLVN